MKKLLRLLLPALVLASCSQEGMAPEEPLSKSTTEEKVTHEMIELGRKLENPYTVKNVSAALSALYPTRSSTEISATDLYVRFLPENQEQAQILDSLGVTLFDYPLDYEIKTDGDYYHDPSIPEDEATWQYAVVPADFQFPEGITCQMLDECFIPDEETVTRGYEDVDWDQVEAASFRLTGNESMLEPQTRGRKVRPEGDIRIIDNGFAGKKTLGVAGVKIIANVFVKYAKGYTDEKGHYELNKKFSAQPHYKIRFRNTCGFKIGFNKVVVTASTSTLGKASASGKSITVDEKSGDKLYRRCVVNNAAYDYYGKCSSYGIPAPPNNLRIWIMDIMKPSCALMMHHGTVISHSLVKKYLGVYAALVRIFAPDIILGTKGKDYDYAKIYAVTTHELAHASHFTKVGISYWHNFGEYILKNFLASGSCYGTGNGEDAGYCGVGEMWAYFMENSIYKARYNRCTENGYELWFHPQALMELEEGGIHKSSIFAALGSNVRSIDELFDNLTEICPNRKTVIRRVQKEYFE